MAQMTSYLHHGTILWSETFDDFFMKIRLGDVTWRHVTWFYRFLAKNCQKVLKNCWRQQKLTNMCLLFTIYLKEHYISFNLRGQPSFHDKWFNFYRLWHESPDFGRFSLIFADVSGKVLTSAKKCWRMHKIFYTEFFIIECYITLPSFMVTVFAIQKL